MILCPVHFDAFHQIGGAPSTLYSYTLSARQPQTSSGNIIVKSGDAWYRVAFNGANLTSRTERIRTPLVTFDRPLNASQPLYARFPAPLGDTDAYVVDTNGVLCSAPGGFGVPDQPKKRGDLAEESILNPRTDVDAAPAPVTPIAAAESIAPPGDTRCAKPFAAASVTKAANAYYPDSERTRYIPEALTMVRVTIDGTGNLVDAYVWIPSGYADMDNASLWAAEHTHYQAATAFCAPASGDYLFRVEFSPD